MADGTPVRYVMGQAHAFLEFIIFGGNKQVIALTITNNLRSKPLQDPFPSTHRSFRSRKFDTSSYSSFDLSEC